jgi:REDY-like protein HapK
MPKILVLFNLKSGVNTDEYESWAKSDDVPTVKSLDSVNDFHVLRSTMILGSDAAPPYKYFEIIEVNDLEKFFADVSTDAVQKGAAKFAEYADNPMFIVTDDIA